MLVAIEVHCVEKNPEMVYVKKQQQYFPLKKERHEHFGWHWGE